jgi:hypothetical protein
MWWWVACPQVGADAVVCVLTTTSCFAPRAPDDVVGVARLCARLGVPHLVNNAYGLQCAATTAQLTSACRKGACGWFEVMCAVLCVLTVWWELCVLHAAAHAESVPACCRRRAVCCTSRVQVPYDSSTGL